MQTKDKTQLEKYGKFSLYQSCVFCLQSCWLYIYHDANWPTTPTASRTQENRHRQQHFSWTSYVHLLL